MKAPGINFFILILFFCSCEQDISNTVESEVENILHDELELSIKPIINYKFQGKELAKLAAYGFSGSTVCAVKKQSSTGESVAYRIDGDMLLDQEEVFSFIAEEQSINVEGDKHFRTRQIVKPSIPEILIVSEFSWRDGARGTGRALSVIRGVQLAAIAYDNLDLRLSFRAIGVQGGTRGASYFRSLPNTIMVKFGEDLAGTSIAAEASWPTSDGRPGKNIRINPDRSTRTDIENGRLLVHEIGHAIGMRHTDFFNRDISCGAPLPNILSNEGQGEYGAVQIPGTPGFNYSLDVDGFSVFNSCATRTTPEFFFPIDVEALESLYPERPPIIIVSDPVVDCNGQSCPCALDCRCVNGICISQ